MLNEVITNQRLDSSAFGSLIHAIEVTSATLRADITAGQIFGLPSPEPCSYVSTNRINIDNKAIKHLHNWPRSDASIYDFLQLYSMKDGIYHLTQLQSSPAIPIEPDQFVQPINHAVEVVDSVCLTIQINQDVWAAIVYMRCNDSEPFNTQNIALIEQLKSSIARLFMIGLKRELQTDPNDSINDYMSNDPLELLKKLSKTERIVFNHLLKEMTERQIAEHMDRSRHTIHVYVKNIYNKLNVSSRRKLLDMYEDYDTITVE
ncbi:hypothetical protein JD969_18040 [Planctomycetota bacterium]|nr:hypothetical protein JD969_18040 [Planctomycetota bacterium]